MVGRENLVVARLLGVGSPRNKDRVKDLGPEGLTYIRRHDLWETSRNYVRSLLGDRVVEVWTRKCDRFDDKDRLLVYILIPDELGKPLDVNAEIIRKGLGFVTRDYVHVTFVGYRNLEHEAREHRRGIWGVLSKGRVSSLVQ
jgi:endonuclease YncB( thermonuclease family)